MGLRTPYLELNLTSFLALRLWCSGVEIEPNHANDSGDFDK